MKKKRILITGITGFVGSHLADYLIENEKNIEVHGTVRYHLSRLDHIRHNLNKLKIHNCDYFDSKSTYKLIKEIKPDMIFHMAAQSFVSPSWDHPITYMDANYKMTVNIFEACLQNSLNPIIHIPGSGEEYGDIPKKLLPIDENTQLLPVNPYAVTKIAQDYISYVYFRSYGLKVIRTRGFNHEGSRRDKVFGLPMIAYQIAKIEKNLQNPIIEVGVLTDRRNFTHVKDMVRAYWLAANKCKFGELYIIGNSQDDMTYTYKELLEMTLSKTNLRNVKYKSLKKYIRPTQVPRLICDDRKFKKLVKWKPLYSINNIIEDTLSYWRSYVENYDLPQIKK